MAQTPVGPLTCLSGTFRFDVVPDGRGFSRPADGGVGRVAGMSVRASTCPTRTDLTSLERDGGEVDVPAELRVHLGSLDAGAVDEGELLADQRDDRSVLADLLVDVTPGLLAGVGVGNQVGGVDGLVDGVAVVPAVVL